MSMCCIHVVSNEKMHANVLLAEMSAVFLALAERNGIKEYM